MQNHRQVEFWRVYTGFIEHLLPVKNVSLMTSQAGPLCVSMHIYTIIYVCMCVYMDIKVLDTSCDFQSFHRVSYSSSQLPLGCLCISNGKKISDLYFICVLLNLFTHKTFSLCKSLCDLIDRFVGITSWSAVPEMQCDGIVYSGFKRQQHKVP